MLKIDLASLSPATVRQKIVCVLYSVQPLKLIEALTLDEVTSFNALFLVSDNFSSYKECFCLFFSGPEKIYMYTLIYKKR